MLAKIWAFIWPPIDRSPIEPVATPVSETSQPIRFHDHDDLASNSRRAATRIPPHQRYQVMTADQRWSAYSSLKHSSEANSAVSPHQRLRAS